MARKMMTMLTKIWRLRMLNTANMISTLSSVRVVSFSRSKNTSLQKIMMISGSSTLTRMFTRIGWLAASMLVAVKAIVRIKSSTF